MRQRIFKRTLNFGHTIDKTDYYLRDAQGNIMAVYSVGVEPGSYSGFKVKEFNIYGSSRLGVLQDVTILDPEYYSEGIPNPNNPATPSHTTRPLGKKRYELTNHLGNVLAVITDRKRPRAQVLNTGYPIEWYEADVLSSQQYYAFGMLMPGDDNPSVRRQYSKDNYDYRFGFNGKEGDDEVKGDDNQQDYGMRIYDPRVGRFLSVDPITSSYPWYSPYPFAGNRLIFAVNFEK